MRLLILLLLAASTTFADDAVFQIEKVDQDAAEANASGTLKLTADFGHAVVDLRKVDEIRIGETSTLTTSDGTVLRGNVDWSDVTFSPGGQTEDLASWKTLQAIRRAELKAGQTTMGRVANRISYYLHAPAGYTTDSKWPALVLLHGSNMNAKSYIDSVLASWPELGETHLLIGINGERRSSSGSPDSPRFNYSYVNFVGKSKYKGYPGTDRESPALVAELLTELRERLPIKRCYLIGHSQGGFLTYSVAMNYPELVDGAVPVSAGAIVQVVPSAYDDQELIEQQKQTPIAIVHGTTDRAVSYKQATATFEAFKKAEFPKVKLFSDENAAHRFMMLPIDKAVIWLDDQQGDVGA
ncbi:MAG: alpha/beta fold hydrolase [Planctomycetota bacterium]